MSQTPWSPACPDLLSLTPASLSGFCRKSKQPPASLRGPRHPPRPQSPEGVYSLPITCTNAIRKHLSTPSLFTFKGLNSLFTGLSTSRGPDRSEKAGRSFVWRGLVLPGLFLLLSCNIHDNRVGLFFGALWGSIGGATLSQERPLFMWI